MIYGPRADWVLVRVSRARDVKGLQMPQTAVEGKEFTVEAIGPDALEHGPLKVGDKVLMTGSKSGAEFYPLPNNHELILIRSEFVALVLREEE